MLKASLATVLAVCALLLPLACAQQTEIAPGLPVTGSVTAGGVQWYKVPISPLVTGDFTVTVTPISGGNPDIYASCTQQYPSSATPDTYSARLYGEDSITIPKSALSGSWVYVTVATSGTGFTVSYRILADFVDLIALSNGIPVVASVYAEETQYFQLTIPPSSPDIALTLTSNSIIASTYMLVSTSATKPEAGNPSTYQYDSRMSTYANVVSILKESWGPSGIFTIGVVGGTADALFSLVAWSTLQTIALRNGYAVRGLVPLGPYVYYNYTIAQPTCDLRVTLTPVTLDPNIVGSASVRQPTNAPGNYDKISDSSMGSDSIYWPANTAPGTYYFGVYRAGGFNPASSIYSILVTSTCTSNDTQAVTYLSLGMPQEGNLLANQWLYYRVQIQDLSQDVSFTLTRHYGDPDMYITNNNRTLPNQWNYMWQSTNLGSDVITVLPSDFNSCASRRQVPCVYFIAVRADSDTSFSIAATSSTITTLLQDGVAMVDYVTQGHTKYYQFPFDATSQLTVSMSVTDLGRGNPNLYVSLINPKPSPTNYTWSGVHAGSDAVMIPYGTANYPSGQVLFYLAVVAASSTYYSIVATTSSTVRLQDGFPQSGQVLNSAFQYYSFDVLQGYGHLTITVTNRYGLSAVYINSKNHTLPPSETSYDVYLPWWTTTKTYTFIEDSAVACTMQSRGPGLSPGCRYMIGVHGDGNNNNAYVLVASTQEMPTYLVNAVPQRVVLVAGETRYFFATVDSGGNDLSIMATPLSGDPDIYVSNHTNRPSATNNDWRSANWGAEALTIYLAAPGTYFIAVVARMNTTCTVLAMITPDSPGVLDVVQLYDGEPQNGFMITGRWSYYRFDAKDDTTSITVAVTRQFGDPDMFIKRQVNGSVTSLPSRTNWDYQAQASGDDLININNVRVPVGTTVAYVIGVFAFSTTGYTVRASSTHTVSVLAAGQAVNAVNGAGSYRYYSLFVDSSLEHVSFVLTPFSGNPDLYVATGFLPTISNYTWGSSSTLTDGLTISTTDSRYCAHCNYFIGVFCRSACAYSIIGTFGGTIGLQNGQPVYGQVGTRLMQFYSFYPDGNTTTITATLTPLSGWPIVFARVNSEPSINDGEYDWLASAWRSTATMTIKQGVDSKFCTYQPGVKCVYYFGIYGIENSTYTLTVVGNSGSVALVSGVPVSGNLQQGYYAYYTFRVPAPGLDTGFIVTPLSGDPDLYVSSRFFPNSSAYDLASRTSEGDSILVFQGNVTFYYIAVYAWTTTSYTMLAVNYNDSDVHSQVPVVLVDGQPQSGLVLKDQYHYYLYTVSGAHTQLVISLSRRFGDPDLFINGPSTSVFPNRGSYQWGSQLSGNDIVKISAPPVGTYRIAVLGYSDADFTIIAATNDAGIQLQNSIPYQGQLNGATYQYFTFFVGDTSHDLTLTLTSFVGDPDLYVLEPPPGCRGTDYQREQCQNQLFMSRPNTTNYNYVAAASDNDAISIPRSRLFVGWYQISVYAWVWNCSYSLVANYANNTWLQDGVPQRGVVAKEQSMWYQFRAPATRANVTFSVTTVTGRVGLYVSPTATLFPIYNDPRTYQWSATGTSATLSVTVNEGANRNCTLNQCTYTIMVYGNVGSANSSYSITAATNMASIALLSGIPARSTLASGSYDYFFVRLQSPNSALTVSVTPIGGWMGYYMATDTRAPTADTAKWQGWMYGDPIHVAPGDDGYIMGTYYISVYAYTDSSYTITANVIDLAQTNGSTVLINGIPQLGWIREGFGWAYYTFPVRVSQTSEPFDVTFLVTPSYGDPDFYITNDGSTPSSTNYQWHSQQYGRDSVMVHGSCYSCDYKIGVLAYWEPTLFSISAATSQAVRELQSGISVMDRVVKNQYKYYAFEVVSWWALNLVFSLTSISGDPDLFIASPSSEIVYPNQTHHTYAKQAGGSDVFSLNPPIEHGVWFLSVFGFNNATYSLTASVGATLLVAGEPHQDIVSYGDSRLYAIAFYPQNPTTPLVFTVDLANNGWVDMYVCAETAYYDYCAGDVPGPNDPQSPGRSFSQYYAGTQGTATASITISFPAVAGSCQNCTWYLSVVGRSRSVYYITASYGQLSTLLPVGRSISGSVKRGEYVYYRGMVDNVNEDINIDVTEYVGDLTVVVSTSIIQPTTAAGKHTWMAHDANTHGDHIQVSRSDPNFVVGIYYIGVYGDDDSKFAITFTNNLLMLVPGVPQLAQASSFGTFFFVNVDQNSSVSDVIVTLSPSSIVSAPTDVYDIFVTNNSTLSTKPSSADEAMWTTKSLAVGYSMVMRRTDPLVSACTTCTYYLGVFCANCGFVSNPLFTITVSLDNQVNQLLANQYRTGIVTPSQFNYYQIFIAQANNVTVFVEPCVGNAIVYTSLSQRKPVPGAPGVDESSPSEGVSFISKSFARTETNVYLGVRSVNQYASSTYRIYAVVNGPRPQTPDIGNRILKLALTDASSVSLSFQAATPFVNGNLRYNVYAFEQPADGSSPFNMFTACGLTSSSSKVTDTPLTSSAAQVGQTLQYAIKGLHNGGTYFVNVIVEQLDAQNNVVGFPAVYRFGEIVLQAAEPTESFMDSATAKVLLGIGIPGLVLLLGFFVYLVVKNRKLTQELTGVEMQDMPKHKVIKAMRGPPRGHAHDEDNKPNKNTKAYDRLIATDEATSDEYLPPQSSNGTGTDDHDSLVEQI